MEINPTSAASMPTAAKKTAASDAAAAPATDFQTFLTLLTTQMRNQDPLKPVESTEFVSQLASFSAVEQQIRSNDRLESILDVLSGGAADGLAAWIGKEVRAPGKADFTGEPVEVEVTPVPDTDRAVLVVTNDFGTVVARHAVDPATGLVAWDGSDDLGAPVAHGRYAFQLESYSGDDLVDTQDARVYGKVTEVRLTDGEPLLVLESGSQVSLDEVTALR
jgi:flagellar basal-body rod modification protein FlgD